VDPLVPSSLAPSSLLPLPSFHPPLIVIENTAEKFTVSVDVSHFKPEEVKVNLNGNDLTIEGDHEEKSDEIGTIKRFILPEDTNLDSLRSSLSDEGHLTIEAP
ncbi:hypothetical protein PMAYCL1PPCAC_14706, partial [Pristionchus mayeri]